MQLAVVEFSRNQAGLIGANSSEFNNKTKHPVVGLITEWQNQDGKLETRNENSNMGGTMRLGSQKAPIKSKTLAHKIYGKIVNERHRHRYKVNNDYVDQLIKAGLVVSARTPSEHLCEIIELPLAKHPWFLGCQFHPEFTSNPKDGHPLFISYLKAALEHQHLKGN